TEADVVVGAERRRDVLAEEAADALAADAAHELADEMPEGERGGAVARAGLPPGSLPRERLHERIPGEELLDRDLAARRRETRLVREQPAHGDALLALR